MMNGGMGGNLFGNFIFSFIMIIIVVLVVAVLVWMFRKPNNQNNNSLSSHHPEDSLEILKSRLAKGEISEEEYERLKNKLRS
ncbi:hypothetical protein CEY16_06475 [Halalkalibacillus sediminis]|uniref:SHOCT domain-containing protein n=1 Tax=Halalkalibacillus sediminis TaxID=2018042 RepID=A0A2I0QTE2_9BACI|nr:SHOCT domain-containing protein [Halalkalibacillus sediminis]PKR77579.1 hypothetical protein CEY16_06475 [Halalkalibacillus sediminis]